MNGNQAFQQALALSKKFTRESLLGGGALVGKNVKISSIVPINGGNRVTFSYVLDDGREQTSSLDVMDGKDGKDGNPGVAGENGVGITGIEKINSVGLVDTYRITFSNGQHYDFEVKNGEQGIQGIPGSQGEAGQTGQPGIQGIQGEPGRDGYPFLIYKEYADISEFKASDFPEIGLMFMVNSEQDGGFPVYRYTGEGDSPYSYVTSLKSGEAIKGDPGVPGKDGEQGIPGLDGKDGTTYTPRIGSVTTIPYGNAAAASVTVDEETKEAVFDFSIPAGKDGEAVQIDDFLSLLSENPVQNKVITEALAEKGSTLFYDEELSELQLKSGDTILSVVEIKGGSGGGGLKLAKPSSISLANADEAVIIKWSDPPNLVLDGAMLAEWAGTLVVRKAGSAPNSKTDGVVVVDSKIQDEYKTTGFSDNNLTNGVEYFYGIFPYTTDGVYTYGTTENITPAAIYPDAPKNVSVSGGDGIIKVNFTLPENAVSAKISYSTQQPESVAEPYGTVISNAESPYVIAGLTNDIPYYVTVCSVNAKGRTTAGNVLEVTPKQAILYGFIIDQNESDPASMITYIEDNKDFTPAHMDYANDRFDYGSWGDAWFIKGLKPCMLNYDGTVAYELDPNDYTKKLDGTASDVANADFPGNAMVGIPKVYWKIVDNGDNTANVYICDKKLDNDFVCWSHIDANGDEIDYCYMACYEGSLQSGKLRSLSGKTPMASQNAQAEINYAKANNPSGGVDWYTGVFCDWQLINLLLLLIGRSTDTQAVFGAGNNAGGQSGIKATGTMNTKGLFWGNQDNKSGVKVFGIEHWWGNLWKRIAGWVNDRGTQKVKMTYGQSDGSTVTGYNTDGSGYMAISGGTPGGASGGYISKSLFSPKGIIPVTASGSATTKYCDGLWFSSGQNNYALVDGGSGDGARVGAFCARLGNASSNTHWNVAAAVSCKPLA